MARKPRKARQKQRRFSMIRDFALADVVTLINGVCGMASVLSSMKFLSVGEPRFFWTAFGLLPVALVADVADGRIARWRQRQSMMGQELDSLADLVSFGVAPAALAFAMGMQGGWDAAVLVYFVACGISRLARYNSTAASLSDEGGKVKYFEGTPIPSSLLLVALLAIMASQGAIGERIWLGSLKIGPWYFHPLVLIYGLSGSAMISKTLRIPKP